MAVVKISLDQFVLVGDQTVHAPTGSWWKVESGKAELSAMFTGRTAAFMNDSDEYGFEKIRELAFVMLLSSNSL